MNYKKVLDDTPNNYFLIKDKNNKVIYPRKKEKLDYIRNIYMNYSKESKYSTFENKNYSIKISIVNKNRHTDKKSICLLLYSII